MVYEGLNAAQYGGQKALLNYFMSEISILIIH